MRYLIRGGESAERFDLLLSLTRINSEDIIAALKDHLVIGISESDAAVLNRVKQQNFNRALKQLNAVAETVENIKAIDWKRFNIT